MQPRRLVFSLLILGMGALLGACTTPTDGLLAEQGLGHFNAKSVDIDLGDGTSGLRTQVISTTTTAKPIFVDGIALGIGNDDYTVTMSVAGKAVLSCTNQGQHMAPGQNPVFESDSNSSIDNSAENKGRYPFAVDNSGALSEDAVREFLNSFPFPCPNPNWTLSLVDIDWKHIDLFLYDPASPPPSEPDDPDNPVDELHYNCITNLEAGTIDCTRTTKPHDPI